VDAVVVVEPLVLVKDGLVEEDSAATSGLLDDSAAIGAVVGVMEVVVVEAVVAWPSREAGESRSGNNVVELKRNIQKKFRIRFLQSQYRLFGRILFRNYFNSQF